MNFVEKRILNSLLCTISIVFSFFGIIIVARYRESLSGLMIGLSMTKIVLTFVIIFAIIIICSTILLYVAIYLKGRVSKYFTYYMLIINIVILLTWVIIMFCVEIDNISLADYVPNSSNTGIYTELLELSRIVDIEFLIYVIGRCLPYLFCSVVLNIFVAIIMLLTKDEIEKNVKICKKGDELEQGIIDMQKSIEDAKKMIKIKEMKVEYDKLMSALNDKIEE